MKKTLLLAVFLAAGILSTQAQPYYFKQVITFSLTGNAGPETEKFTATRETFTPLAFKLTDKDFCKRVASDNGIIVKAPQLVKINDTADNFYGYYIMDGKNAVLNVTDLFGRTGHQMIVHSGTDTLNTRTFIHTVSQTVYSFDTWSLIDDLNLVVAGKNTSPQVYTYPDGFSDLLTTASVNYSATLFGTFSYDSAPYYGPCSGTIRAVSSVVKTAIPGL